MRYIKLIAVKILLRERFSKRLVFEMINIKKGIKNSNNVQVISKLIKKKFTSNVFDNRFSESPVGLDSPFSIC